MKIIFKIARAELRNLFYSPVAWITIVAYFTVSGIQFVSPLMDLARIQEVSISNNPAWPGFQGPLTFKLFAGTLQQVLTYIYLFVPLLTMGVINREQQAGTIRLLSSSPVSVREIVLGKYLGLIIFNLVLLLSVAILLFTGYFTIQHAELKWFLSMLLGFFLYSSCYMALGMFISSLTQYQIVAGIVSFIVFFLLGIVGGLFQQYDILRDITFFLSISGRTESLLSGLITTRDLFYFSLIIILFVGLTIIRLKSKQESRGWKLTLFRNLGLIACILTIGYFSGRPGNVGYLDVTRNQLNTLDTATQRVLREMDGSPLTVTLYTNLLGFGVQEGLPVKRNQYVWGTWERIRRFYPNVKLKYEYYYDAKEGDTSYRMSNPNMTIHEAAALMAKLFEVDTADFKKPGEINKMVDLSREEYLKLVMELEYKGKKSLMRFLNQGAFTEPISGAIRRLTRERVPSVLFTTGHYERSPWRNGEREFGSHANSQVNDHSMVNDGIDADTISLLQKQVPDKTDILVVADPKSKLESSELGRVWEYIEKGGNAIFYSEPGKQQILNPILNKMGVHVEDGILVKTAPDRTAHHMVAFATKKGNYLSREHAMQFYQKTGNGGAFALFYGTGVLNFKDTAGFAIEPVISVQGSQNTWIEKGLFVPDSATPVFKPAEGDIQKSEYIVGVKLTRTINNREQRIVVLADADFMSRINENGKGIRQGFYSWLLYNDYPVYTDFIIPEDVMLTIGRNTGKLLWYTYVYILPGALLLTGSIMLIRRRRK